MSVARALLLLALWAARAHAADAAVAVDADSAVDVDRAPHWYRPAPGPHPPRPLSQKQRGGEGGVVEPTPSTPTTPSPSTAASPQRIVSLAPALTETLFAVGAGSRVVGVTRFCDRPAAAQGLPVVGGYSDASLEAILLQRPDLVVAMPNLGQRALLDRLRDRGVPVFVAFTDTLAEQRAMVRAVAAVVDAAAAGDALVADADARVAAVARAQPARGVRAVVVVGRDPFVVAGHGSFANDALVLLGATSVMKPSDAAWPQWSLESFVARGVDVVVVADVKDAGPVAAGLAALGPRAPRVLAAPRTILMRPGPSFADDVVALAALLAPPGAPTAAAP